MTSSPGSLIVPTVLRTVFMGTPEFAATILQKLVAEGLPPVAVVCQPARAAGRGLKQEPSAVEALAQQLGLPVFPVQSVNTPEMVAELTALKADLFLVAAFGQLLKKEILDIPRLYSLNVHGSLLPKYRGAAPIQRAILDGQTLTGVTIQKMVKKLDAGDILLTKTTPISESDTSVDLFERLAVLGAEALIEAVRLIDGGTPFFTPQVEADATVAPKLTKEEAVIDWTQPAPKILRKVNGLQPWPVAQSALGGVRLKVYGAEMSKASGPSAPGDISTDHKTRVLVGCGGGTALSLTRIQLENRKKLEIKDFLTAYRGNFPFENMG